MEYLASFVVDCKFSPEFESCYIFAQIKKRRLAAWIQDIFQVCFIMEITYALGNETEIHLNMKLFLFHLFLNTQHYIEYMNGGSPQCYGRLSVVIFRVLGWFFFLSFFSNNTKDSAESVFCFFTIASRVLINACLLKSGHSSCKTCGIKTF